MMRLIVAGPEALPLFQGKIVVQRQIGVIYHFGAAFPRQCGRGSACLKTRWAWLGFPEQHSGGGSAPIQSRVRPAAPVNSQQQSSHSFVVVVDVAKEFKSLLSWRINNNITGNSDYSAGDSSSSSSSSLRMSENDTTARRCYFCCRCCCFASLRNTTTTRCNGCVGRSVSPFARLTDVSKGCASRLLLRPNRTEPNWTNKIQARTQGPVLFVGQPSSIETYLLCSGTLMLNPSPRLMDHKFAPTIFHSSPLFVRSWAELQPRTSTVRRPADEEPKTQIEQLV